MFIYFPFSPVFLQLFRCLFIFFQPKPAYKCLKSMLGDSNNNRYFVATQDPALRDKCRKIPGTPILYLHHCAPVLEKPSEMSETQANKAVGKKLVSHLI